MTMYGFKAYKSLEVTIPTANAVSLEDVGFTTVEVQSADICHIQHINGSSELRYWYTLEDVAGVPTVKIPKGTLANGTPEGHIIQQGGEFVVNGTANIRNFRVIADIANVTLAITLSKYD